MSGKLIFEHLRNAASQYTEQCAIVDGDERITYGRLLERAGAIRAWLQSAMRPREGDVIAASLANSWQFVASFWAVSELGCVFLPCNPNWRAAELEGLVKRLQIRGVITEPQFRAEWDQMSGAIPPQSVLSMDQGPSLHEVGAASSSTPPQTRSEDDPVVYMLTSGSTGVPHVVPRSHRNLIAGTRSVALAMGVRPGWRFSGVSPLYHAMGFNNSLLVPLLNGATLVLMRRFSAVECAQSIYRERVEVLLASPFIFSLLVDGIGDPGLLSTLRLCYAGAARMPATLPQRWRNRFGIRLRPWYGMTETHVVSFDSAPEQPAPQAGAYVGMRIPGVELRSLGPDGQILGPGEIGEVAVRSEGVMSAYVDEPELNQHLFVDGFFRTGDLGYLDPGGHVYLTGRARRVVNIGGLKVDPVEIEQVVEALAGVEACHVDAASHERTGEMIRARILLRPGAAVSRSDVIEHCRQRLAEYKLPRIIELMEASAVTLTGKLPADSTVAQHSPKNPL